jgi:tmRNA-binding protein
MSIERIVYAAGATGVSTHFYYKLLCVAMRLVKGRSQQRERESDGERERERERERE